MTSRGPPGDPPMGRTSNIIENGSEVKKKNVSRQRDSHDKSDSRHRRARVASAIHTAALLSSLPAAPTSAGPIGDVCVRSGDFFWPSRPSFSKTQSPVEPEVPTAISMQLFVRSEYGHTIVVSASGSTNVATLASLCEAEDSTRKQTTALNTSLPRTQSSDAYLSYGGVPMRPHCTLDDYDIKDNATLTHCVRMRGGCFAFSITLWIIIFILFLLSVCTCGLSLPFALVLIPIALLLPLCCL